MAQGFTRIRTGNALQILNHVIQAGVQGTRHVRTQNQQFSHTLGFDNVAIDLAIDLEAADAAQDAVLRVGGPSKGADDEVEIIRAAGGRVFMSIDQVPPAE